MSNLNKMYKKDLSWIKQTPIAHRALHDEENERLENSLGAVRAAIEAGYSIEIDLQYTKDKLPVVFHDPTLGRLTKIKGFTRTFTMSDLSKIELGETQDRIPSLRELLDLVDGKIGIVIEMKGITGTDDGFAAAVLDDLKSYKGNVAIMSFDHWLLDDLSNLNCPYPVGLVAEGDDTLFENHVKAVKDYDLDFISYGIDDLPNEFVSQAKKSGMPIICWTVKDQVTAEKAYKYTDQITFEGFKPS